MDRLAVGGDRGLDDLAVLVLEDLGLGYGLGTSLDCNPVRLFGVGHPQCDVVDAVAVIAYVLGDLAIGAQGAGEDEA